MKIISWNCHYGLNLQKYLEIIKYDPEILVIQEITKNDFDFVKSMWKNKNWYNDDLNDDESKLGVAIFSNDYEIAFTDIFNRKYRYVIPYVVSNSEYKFTLFSVWIKPVEKNYVKPFEEAIDYYKNKKMLDDNSIVIGDFNTFSKKDNGRLRILEEKLNPMINCTKDTQFLDTATYYDAKYGYGTDDFCFVSKDIKDNYEIDINIPDEWDEKKDKNRHWNGLSDHCPIIIELR
jgi:exonuclease III